MLKVWFGREMDKENKVDGGYLSEP